LTFWVCTVDYLGIEITVPTPEAYILHKIIINSDRNNDAKRDKDRNSILAIFPHLDKEIYSMLLGRITKKQQKAVNVFWQKLD